MVMMENRPAEASRAQLIEALRTITQLQEQLRASREERGTRTEPVAIVGRSLRMPGGADSPRDWWPLLHDGVDATSEFPADRADARELFHPDPDHPGTAHVIRGGFLGRVDGFDPAVFGISPREATGMDPQQRMALELCWEALEDAAIAPDRLTDTATGVFLGVSTTDYVRMRQRVGDMRDIDAYQLIGEPSFIAGRISFTLGLQGPSCVLDTACSSSLVALHQAVRSLRLGETDLALAGGVNLLLDPYGFVLMSKFRALSPDGRCKTFDESADGYARGEGGAVVTLMRLRDAIAQGRQIRAVVAGTSVNHDGRSSGMTVPNAESQQKLMRAALADAGLTPAEVDYVEAHGTGTALGDPIELRSINAVYGERPDERPVVVGSVKSNIGHLEPAAGIAGVTKVLLALEHEQIPPNLHLTAANSKVDWDRLAVTVPTAVRDWRRSDRRRIAAVSSFGASGTNAHAILAEPPALPERQLPAERAEVLLLSARTPAALTALAERYADQLPAGQAPVADLAWTSQTGRARLDHGLAVVGASTAELVEGLRNHLSGTADARVGAVQRGPHHKLRSAWLFTGQGAQYPNMAAGLLDVPAFAAAARECTELFDQHLDVPLAEVIWGAQGALINDTAYTQPALFTVEYALAKLLLAMGHRPHALVGHSIGEIAAAAVAGVLGLPDAALLVATRGRLMSALPAGGAMLAITAGEQAVLAALGELPAEVSLAAVNSPTDTVLSGAAQQIADCRARLTDAGLKTVPLVVSHAFHSPLLEPMLAEFRTALAGITMHRPSIPMISSLTGEPWDADCGTPDYWVRQARGTVRFADAVTTLVADGCAVFAELGPHPVLIGSGKRGMTGDQLDEQLWVAPLRRGADDRAETMAALGRLQLRGLDLDWAPVHADAPARYTALPTYPWQRERYWFTPSDAPAASGPIEDGLGQRLGAAIPTWQDSLAEPLPADGKLGWLLDRAARAATRAGLLVGGLVDLGAAELGPAPAAAAAYPCLVQTTVEPDGLVTVRAASPEQAAAGAEWQLVGRVRVPAGAAPEPDPDGFEPPVEVAEDSLDPIGRIVTACSPDAPVALDRLRVGDPALVRSVAVRQQPGERAVDALLLAADGSVLGTVTGLRPAEQPLPQRAPWYRSDELVLVPDWRELADGDAGSEPLLLVGGPAELAAALAEQSQTTRLSDEELLARIEAGEPPAPGRIVLLAAAGLPDADQVTAAVLAERELPAERLVLRVTRWLAEHAGVPARLSIVTRGAVRVGAEQRRTGPAGGPLWGLGRVLAVEHPASWGGLVDLDPELDLTDVSPADADLIVRAVRTSGQDDQQAVRGSSRYGARVRRAAVTAPARGEKLLRGPGTVLVTGGLGGIGLALAAWCARRGVDRLVLTSRSAEPPADSAEAAADRWAAVRRLRERGVAVEVAAADVTDAAAMTELVGRLAADERLPLRGVVHAAGLSEPQFVVDVDDEAYRRVWEPKVLGGWTLHEATRGLDLDLFVLFSSIAASWGSQHLASYAAGNAFLDALAETRAAAGLPVTSVAWGPWELPSSLFGQDVLDFLESVGLRQLAADQCLTLLGGAIASGRPQTIVCAADWARYRPVMEARGPRPILHDIEIAEAAEAGGAAALAEVLAAGERGGAAARAEALTGVLAGIVAGVLGIGTGDLRPETDVFVLGLDSIMVMEVTTGCRRQLGLSVPPSGLFERSTLGEWVQFVLGLLDDSLPAEADSDPFELVSTLKDRSELPADIQPAAPARSGLGRQVLLTGATGFVGAYLLRELLADDPRRQVDCLVRCAEPADGLRRILANAGGYFDAGVLDTDRIRVLPGDLAAPRLGLAEDEHAALLHRTDSIVHNGAWVHFAHSYDQLEPANVDGTVELIRASAATGIPLHHVSTYGIWGLPTDGRDRVGEDESILTAGRLVTGYVQTKWSAEHLAQQAAERGIPVTIYRLGRVLGDSVTGAALTTHFTCRVIKSCIQLGVAPDLDITVEMTPVDYVTAGLVAIAGAGGSAGAYHLVNPVHMPFAELVATIRDRGWDVETIPALQWWDRLVATQGEEANELHSVMPTVEELIVGGERAVHYDTGRADAALAGTGISCPPLDRALLDRYFDYFLDTGYLTR
ncbi:MAG TPA: thioester reductase domain-containing protein [Jatrophihabitans sp.]|nr:thioester reductase domain-containing protein [Jatrophihabitans sp.]